RESRSNLSSRRQIYLKYRPLSIIEPAKAWRSNIHPSCESLLVNSLNSANQDIANLAAKGLIRLRNTNPIPMKALLNRIENSSRSDSVYEDLVILSMLSISD